MSIKKRAVINNDNDLPDGSHDVGPSPDYEAMLRDVMPALEWLSAKGAAAGPELQEQARRAIVRFYISQTRRPGLAKTRAS